MSSTSPGIKMESLPASHVCLPEPVPRSAGLTNPAVPEALINEERRGREGQGQCPPRHRSEGGLVDKGDLKKLPRLSLSQYDLIEADVSFQPWGSENSVLIPEPVTCPQGSIREHLQSKSPQDSLSSSCPQCHTIMAKPAERLAGTLGQVDLPFSQGMNSSDSEVAVTLIDTSQPGDPLSLHEPIKIVITMSSTPNSTTEEGSSLHLKVTGTEQVGSRSHVDPASPRVASPPNAEHIQIPVITLELSDGGGGVTGPEGHGNQRTPDRLRVEASDQCSSEKVGRTTQTHSPGPRHAREPALTSEAKGEKDGQDTLDPSSCKGSHEKRHARVLSVDSGTNVFLGRSSTDVVSDKEKTLPTSKSDLEAKEGQIPNESNFLEFVSLLESISTSKVVASTQPKGSADPHGTSEARELYRDHYSQGKKEEILEKKKFSGQDSKPEKPGLQSQDHAGASPVFTPPAKTTTLFQGNRQRQIIYRVTSQQDSSVLQVISGPEASVQEEISVDAMHVFIDEHGEIKSCYLKSGNQKEGSLQHPLSNEDCASQAREVHLSSSSTTTCESPDPTSGDPAVSALQQQLLLMVARRTHSETPRCVSQDLEDSSCSSAPGKFNREQFYKFIIFPGKWIKVWYDRLTLLALLDRTEDVRENVLAVVLSILVSLLGFLTLNRGFCRDLWVLLFCVVMASCQYSLLKARPHPALTLPVLPLT
ncbi:Pecanex-like protein 2 [Fukomys damarensis]|uniref:Pecanex-like protein n=1 Tax=Fukomys damarensis TaxID=885580 RepID=A0A091EFT8_FUKDA|nr:Pecanex-like protein 2 [Fukomys damarensis]